ncbi:flavoprotein [Dictyobacter kobayashii]|uniref:Flavoprotein domain-containing protein n=1 Tax=Dictyobacter kobayashii TaxID=2014872 RepID=A0A402AKE4_9CHLR|nr:flavoprotein [Dictyobacter kobayashii]GCE19495.1 hypothetical protein KDK_32950 [Dictyobacter kobayashii]
MKKALALIVCAALSARQVQDFVLLAQHDNWDVWVIATPNARAFIDQSSLTRLTDHPVTVDTPTLPLPEFGAAVVVPATFNTIRKWSQGIADTYALTLLLEWMRQASFPVLVFPRASSELAQDPAFTPSLAHLQQQGVLVHYRPDLYPPNNNIPWTDILQALRDADNGQIS